MAKAKIEINTELCKSCELCVAACPLGIIAIDKNVMNKNGYAPATSVDPEKCIGCSNCAIMCPDSCIKVIKI